MDYLSEKEYKEITNKPIPENFKYIESLSENIVDIKTFHRIENIDSMSDFRRNLIKKSMVILVDLYLENIEHLNSSLKSYSIDDISLNLENNNFEGNSMYNLAINNLIATGLCYVGV